MKNILYGLWSLILHCLGVFIGVYIFVTINVNIDLSNLEGVGPEGWPDMDPRVRFLLIPLIFLWMSIGGLLATLIIYSFDWKLRMGWPWMFNGLAYSLPISFLVLIQFLNVWLAIVFCMMIFIFSLIFLYKYFGSRVDAVNVVSNTR